MMSKKPEQINSAFKAFGDLNLSDRTSLDKLATSTTLPTDQIKAHFMRYRDTLSSPTASYNFDLMFDQIRKISGKQFKPGERDQLKTEYRQSFQEIKPEAIKKIDEISAMVAELIGPNGNAANRQEYVNQLIDLLRYDGAKIRDTQNGRETELTPDQITRLSAVDHSTLDPNVRRIAALAVLTLTRKPDGCWPETVASRRVSIPDYDLVHYDSEGNGHRRTVTGKHVTQEIKAKELIELLQQDLRVETDDNRRLEKALAMLDAGLTSNEHVADLLLKRIEGGMGQDKNKQLEAIVELASIMSKVRVNETISNALDTNADKATRKG
ncbi:MAG: hypothetical protein K2Z81_12615, partial [Cyanobacteria bacterium]|nr:hypothetical protein [Cyanobacteriota bacterium]